MVTWKRSWTTVLALACLWVSPARAGDDVEWQAELGFESSYHDNYFYRDTPTPEETFLGIFGGGEVTFDTGPADLTLFANAAANWGLDLNDTDFQYLNTGVKVKRGRTRGTLEYSRTFDKVFGEEDDASLFDIDEMELAIRHKLTERLTAQVSGEAAYWNFEGADEERDAWVFEPAGMLRFQIVEGLAVRGGFQWTFKDADAGRYDYDGPGAMVAFELQPMDCLDLFVRYRARWRDYDNADPGDSNFKRDDTVQDVLLNSRLSITDWFGLHFGAGYRNGDSDRSDRNYDAFSVKGGFFFNFSGSR